MATRSAIASSNQLGSSTEVVMSETEKQLKEQQEEEHLKREKEQQGVESLKLMGTSKGSHNKNITQDTTNKILETTGDVQDTKPEKKAKLSLLTIKVTMSDNSKQAILTIDASSTFEQLQEAIQLDLNVPPQQQRLRCAYPPRELHPPTDTSQPLNLANGDKILVDIISDQSEQPQKGEKLEAAPQEESSSHSTSSESEEATATAASMEIQWDPDQLYLDLFQKDMIPGNAIVEWNDLGIQLDIEVAELGKIEKNVTPGNVVVKCKAMLTAWKKKSGKTDELIHALEACELISDAAVIKKDLKGKDKVDDKYLLHMVAPKIASNWNSVAIQLGFSHANSFAPFVNLVEERFRQMLQFWLRSNKAKTLDEIFTAFEEALINIDLIADAENFSKKVKEYKEKK